MKKLLTALILFFGLAWAIPISASCEQKLPVKYQVRFGTETALVRVVEYFSLSCPRCLKFLSSEFEELKTRYIDTNAVMWSFHPVPTDLVTLQMMVFMEKMSADEKKVFLTKIAQKISMSSWDEAPHILKTTAQELGAETGLDLSVDALSQTAAFESAYAFFKQKDPITQTPTLEVQERLFANMPTKQFIIKKIEEALASLKESAHGNVQ